MMVSWYRLVQGRMLQHADAIDWMSVYDHLPLATMDEAAGFTSQHWRDSVTFPPAEGRGDAMRYQHRYGVMGGFEGRQVANLDTRDVIGPHGHPQGSRSFYAIKFRRR